MSTHSVVTALPTAQPSAAAFESSTPSAAQNTLPPSAALPSAPAVAKVKTDRLANIELLRVFSMLEIVRFHDHDDRLPWVGGLGLPSFLLLTATFNCTLTERRGVAKFLRDKRERLFVPWLFWSAVYGSFLALGALRHHQAIRDVLSWDMILAGTSSHLWFVPFAMMSALFVGFTQYGTRNLPDRTVAYAMLGLASIALVGIASIDDTGLAAPIPQWMLSTPSALFGFAMGRLLIATRSKLTVRDVWPVVLCAAALLVLCSAVHYEFLVWRYAVSLCVMVVAFLVPGKPDMVSKFFSPLLFGIYLAHHFVADHLVSKFVSRDFQGFFVVDFAVTACLVWLLKRTAFKRFL
ncbi:MAG TPA: acyltransferase family protein [Polyangiales bacterium]|nr:acyltransferase family protein [Polyangiales bacterium]